jgi:hypothetical protein
MFTASPWADVRGKDEKKRRNIPQQTFCQIRIIIGSLLFHCLSLIAAVLEGMTGKTEAWRRDPQPIRRISPFCRRFTADHPFLVGIVAGGTGYPVSRDKRQQHIHRLLILLKDSVHFKGRLHEKMLGLEKRIGHGRVTAPAEKADIGPELDILGPVHLRIRRARMAYDADRHTANYFPEVALLIEHFVRIHPLIFLLVMTFEANVPLAKVRPLSQKVGPTRFVIIEMARYARDPALGEGKRDCTGRGNIHRMVIIPVIVATQAISVFYLCGSQVCPRGSFRQSILTPWTGTNNSNHCRYDQNQLPFFHISPEIFIIQVTQPGEG